MPLEYRKPSFELLDGFLIAILIVLEVCYSQAFLIMIFVLAFRLSLTNGIRRKKVFISYFTLWYILLMMITNIEGLRISTRVQFSLLYNTTTFVCIILVQLLLLQYHGNFLGVIEKSAVISSILAGVYILLREYNMLAYRWKDFISGNSGYRLGISSNINPNSIAWAFGILALLTIYFTIQKKSISLFAAYVWELIIILFTGSKNGLILALIPVLYYGIKTLKKMNIKFLIITGAALVMLWIAIHELPVLYTLIGRRIDSALFTIGFNDGVGNNVIDEGSTEKRLDMIGVAFKMFSEKPILGWGIGAFAIYSGFGYYCHNNYMEILVSGGIVLFLFYYIPIVILLVKTLYMVSGPKKDLAIMLLMTVFLLDFSTVNFYSNIIFLSRIAIIFELATWNQKGKEINEEV